MPHLIATTISLMEVNWLWNLHFLTRHFHIIILVTVRKGKLFGSATVMLRARFFINFTSRARQFMMLHHALQRTLRWTMGKSRLSGTNNWTYAVASSSKHFFTAIIRVGTETSNLCLFWKGEWNINFEFPRAFCFDETNDKARNAISKGTTLDSLYERRP